MLPSGPAFSGYFSLATTYNRAKVFLFCLLPKQLSKGKPFAMVDIPSLASFYLLTIYSQWDKI